VDARAGRQFALQNLALEVERGRRNRAAAKAGGGIDPFRLVGAGDEGRRVALDLSEETRHSETVRAGEAPERGRRRTYLAILDTRKRSAADPAQRRELIERPSPRPPEFAQALGETQVGDAPGGSLCFHIRKILSQMRTSRRSGYKPAERLRNASPHTRGRRHFARG